MQRQSGASFFSRPKIKRLIGWMLTCSFVAVIASPVLFQATPTSAQGAGPGDALDTMSAMGAGGEDAEELERARLAGTNLTDDQVDAAATRRAATTQTSGGVCDFNTWSGVDWVTCSVFLVVAKILEIVTYLLGRLVMIVVDVLMVFASYNGFSDAEPVRIGWKLVRDMVNMFFILIILASAFATMIGYWEDFNYKRVLPKLLVMAVLVNFSKTLIQLLIDFSQVLMLTFVNAFRAAGAGNFAQALGLMDMMRLPPGPTAADQNSVVDLSNIIIAMMLAVFMLCIGLATMIILTAYLIFRIVGLWMALIASPIAFLATALPDRLKRGLDSFTGKYWSQLVGMLTGGPIIAFFLWLALATVQGVASEGGLAAGLGMTGGSDASPIRSAVGNSNAIASFIIGVSMMLMGLQAAVSSANAMGSATLSAFAGKVQGAGMGLGRLAALSPFLLAGAAGKFGGKAAVSGARFVDRRADLTGRASRFALKATSKYAPTLGSVVNPTLMKGAVMRKKEAEKESGEEAGLYSDLQKYGGQELAQTVAKGYGGPSALKSLSDERKSEVIKHAAGSDEFTKSVVDEQILKMKQSGQHKERVDALKATGVSEHDAIASIDLGVKQGVAHNQRELVQGELELARKRGDTKAIDALDKQIVSNPQLEREGVPREERLKKLAMGDPERLKEVNEWNAYNGENLMSVMEKNGVEIQSGKPVVVDPGQLDSLKKNAEKAGNGKLVEGLNTMEQMIRNSPDQDAEFFKNIQLQKNKADGSMYAYAAKASDIHVRNPATGAMGTRRVNVGDRARNDKQREAHETITTTVAAGGTPAAADLNKYMESGGTLGDLGSMTNYKDTPAAFKAYSSELGTQTANAQASIISGDREAFNKALQPLEAAFNSLDKAGVTTDMKVDVLSEFVRRGGRDVILNMDKMGKDMRASTLKAINHLIERVNDVKKKDSATWSAQERGMVAMVENLSELAETRGAAMPSAPRAAFRRAGTA